MEMDRYSGNGEIDARIEERRRKLQSRKRKVKMRIGARGFTKTTKSKSTRGSQRVRVGELYKRIETLIRGGKIEDE